MQTKSKMRSGRRLGGDAFPNQRSITFQYILTPNALEARYILGYSVFTEHILLICMYFKQIIHTIQEWMLFAHRTRRTWLFGSRGFRKCVCVYAHMSILCRQNTHCVTGTNYTQQSKVSVLWKQNAQTMDRDDMLLWRFLDGFGASADTDCASMEPSK